jgi:hypothetical protein
MGFGQYSYNAREASNPLAPSADSKRQVFNTDQVIHLWAQNNYPRARNGKGSVYFEGATIFSYGSHFPMGHHMPDGAVILNSDRYSVSTSGHQSGTAWAVNHLRQIDAPALRELLSGYGAPLAVLVDVKADSERKAAARRAVADYVEKHALALDDEAGAYFMRLAGKSEAKAGEAFARVKAAVQRAADRQAKADKETAARNDMRRATQYAKMSPRDWTLTLGDVGEWHLDEWLKEVRRYGRVLKKAGYVKLAATLAARVKAAQDEHAAATVALRLSKKHNRIKPLIATARAFAAEAAANAIAPRSADDFWTVHRQLRDLLRDVSTPALQALDDIASEHWHAANEKEREEAAARREAEEAERKAAWLAGESVRWHGSDRDGGALLRVRGEDLETSQGASVPLAHAVKAFRFIKLCRETKRDWNRNGRVVRVGHFTVDSVAADGSIRAGCHRINWPEIERIARAIGAFGDAPSDAALEPTHG